jgi:hypothetical protein
LAVGVLGVALGALRQAEACEPLGWEADVVLPPADAVPVPTNPVLLAVITAPNGWEQEVTLATVDGVEVPLSIELLESSSGEGGLLRIVPQGPLEPQTEYVWSMGPVPYQYPIVTGDESDSTLPTPGEPIASLVDSGVGYGCSDVVLWNEYEIEVPDPGEPVATLVLLPASDPTPERPYARVAGATGTSARVVVFEGEDLCFEVQVVDHAGNAVTAGNACIEGPPASEGSSGDGTGTSGGDETGADTDGTGGTTVEPTTTMDAGSSTAPASETGTEPGPPQTDDTLDEGCACRAERRRSWGVVLLLLAPLLLARRKARARR